MRAIACVMMAALLGFSIGRTQEPKKADEKKPEPITDPTPADFAGMWKTDSFVVKGKGLHFSKLEMTFQPDGTGKGEAVYKQHQGGGRFSVTSSKFDIKHTKIKDEKTKKESTLTHIEGLGGIQWVLTLQSRTKVRLLAIYPTDKGPGVEEFTLTKQSEKSR